MTIYGQRDDQKWKWLEKDEEKMASKRLLAYINSLFRLALMWIIVSLFLCLVVIISLANSVSRFFQVSPIEFVCGRRNGSRRRSAGACDRQRERDGEGGLCGRRRPACRLRVHRGPREIHRMLPALILLLLCEQLLARQRVSMQIWK